MSYTNKVTGEVISDEEFQARSGGSTPEIPQMPSSQGGFLQRLKLSFGGPQAREEIKSIEEAQGTRGRFDVGDIADVAGAALPLAGGIAGSAFGLGGTAAGTAAGQGIRRLIGSAIGADQSTAVDISRDIVTTGLVTYFGGKALNVAFNTLTKTIPEKLISTIFKQTADDIAAEVKTGGINPTQATEILREGHQGDARKMMKYSLDAMKNLEIQLQESVSGQTIQLAKNEKRFITNLISDVISNFKTLKSRYGVETKVVNDGKTLINLLSKVKGKDFPAELVLQARRYIDAIRRASSFKANVKLGPLESVFKNKADFLRHELADQIPEIANLMNRYQIHINAFEDLGKYAAKSQNKNLFDLIDVFIVYGIDPTAYLARRGLQSAPFVTRTAQGLYKAGQFAERAIPQGIIPSAFGTGARRLFQSQ